MTAAPAQRTPRPARAARPAVAPMPEFEKLDQAHRAALQRTKIPQYKIIGVMRKAAPWRAKHKFEPACA